jgi:Ca2+-binding EF-hand superfamily protein
MKKLNKPLKVDKVRDIIVEVFREFIEQERKLEEQKINLVQHSDFNLFDAFAVFDVLSRGSITISEFYNGLLNNLDVCPSQDELDLFISRYDLDRDGKLSFTEFALAFMPRDPVH